MCACQCVTSFRELCDYVSCLGISKLCMCVSVSYMGVRALCMRVRDLYVRVHELRVIP
jgi:hypothetical protein